MRQQPFEAIVTGYGPMVLRVCRAVLGHTATAEDAWSETFLSALRAPARLDAVAREIEEYLTGRRRLFDLRLDLRLARGFRRTVLSHLAEIGYGTTTGYATLARAAGSPRAVRAVGTTCATNPLPIVLPCHRVVRSDGTAGQYVGGAEVKRTLLDLEAAAS